MPIEQYLPDPKQIPQPVARFIAAALSLIAAVAVAIATFDDGVTALFAGGGVLIAGVVCAILADQLLGGQKGSMVATLLGWFVALIFMVTVSLVISCAFFDLPKPLACLFNPAQCGSVLAQNSAGTPPPPATAATANDVQRSSYRVFLQFATYPREAIVAITSQLAAKGWNMQGNGERTSNASRLFEVRYRGEAERAAAEQLARDLTAARPPGETRPAVAKPVRIIAPGTLEVWMGPVTPTATPR